MVMWSGPEKLAANTVGRVDRPVLQLFRPALLTNRCIVMVCANPLSINRRPAKRLGKHGATTAGRSVRRRAEGMILGKCSEHECERCLSLQ